MVLVIEWGAVPIDMNVNVVNMDVVREDTSENEGDVDSLSKWVWRVEGGRSIELEATGFIFTLAVRDFTSIMKSVGLDSEGRDHVFDEVLRKIVLERNLSDGDVVGSDNGDEKCGGKLKHFFEFITI